MSEAFYVGWDLACPNFTYQKVKVKKNEYQLKKITISKPRKKNYTNPDLIPQSPKKSIFDTKFNLHVPKYKKILAGQCFAGLIDYFDNLWVWGYGNDGQLGHNKPVYNQKVPLNFSNDHSI